MTDTHQQQRDASIAKSLENAGIRWRYQGTRLSDTRHRLADQLTEWIKGPSIAEPNKGLTFVGGNKVEELAVLTARGLHLTGRAVRLMSIMRFATLLFEEKT